VPEGGTEVKKELRTKLVKFLRAAEDLHVFVALRGNCSREVGDAIDSIVRIVREVDATLPEESGAEFSVGLLGGEQFTFGPTWDLAECLRQRPDAGLAVFKLHPVSNEVRFIGNGTEWRTPA
jgi:hypothetical protein